MKDHEEMARDVLRRVEAYRAAKRARRKIIAGMTVTLCCIGLLALAMVGTGRQSSPDPTLPVVLGTADTLAATEDSGTIRESQTTLPEEASREADRIIIAHIDEEDRETARMKMKICLLWEDHVPMTPEELSAYYGTNVFPEVPEDLQPWREGTYGIFRRDGGSGEVYWDGNIINYSNRDFDRSVNIEVLKDGLPPSCYAIFTQLTERSVIGGTEVSIGWGDSGHYYVEFIYRNVGFRIVAEGLSQEELIGVISSLVRG